MLDLNNGDIDLEWIVTFKSPGLPKQFQGRLQINIESSGSINDVQM